MGKKMKKSAVCFVLILFLAIILICFPDAADDLGGFDVSIESGELASFSDWEWGPPLDSDKTSDLRGDEDLPEPQADVRRADDEGEDSRIYPDLPQPAGSQEEIYTEQRQPAVPQEGYAGEARPAVQQTPPVMQESVIYIIPGREPVPSKPASSSAVSFPEAVAFIEEDSTGEEGDRTGKEEDHSGNEAAHTYNEAAHTDREADPAGMGSQNHLQDPAPAGTDPSLQPDFRYEVREGGIEIVTPCMAEILSFRVNGRETSYHWEENLLCPDAVPEGEDFWISAAVLLDGSQVVLLFTAPPKNSEISP